MPGMKAYWLTSYKKDEQTGQYSPTHDQVLATLKRTQADGLDTRANTDVLTPAFVQKLRNAGLEFHCWTVNDPALARQMIQLGVDSITTDRPAYLRSQLAPQ
jgi:glycerophosphoryl diester phosphodiesterase